MKNVEKISLVELKKVTEEQLTMVMVYTVIQRSAGLNGELLEAV